MIFLPGKVLRFESSVVMGGFGPDLDPESLALALDLLLRTSCFYLLLRSSLLRKLLIRKLSWSMLTNENRRRSSTFSSGSRCETNLQILQLLAFAAVCGLGQIDLGIENTLNASSAFVPPWLVRAPSI